MSDEKALLAAIWKHPHDDTPRLVYADWLQENGQPERAEFIRVQCELARLEVDEPKRANLEARETRIWRKHGQHWKTGLPGNVRCNRFHRGFPSNRNVAIPASRFLKLTAMDLGAVPLWDYFLTNTKRVWPQLLQSPNLLRLGKFRSDLSDCGPDGVRHLTDCTYARNLAVLSVSSWEIGFAGLDLLMNATTLPALMELDLSHNSLKDEGAMRLAASPLFKRLQILNLEATGLGHKGYTAIIQTAGAERLESLRLAFNPLGDRAIRALTQLSGLSGVRSLYLYRTALTNVAATNLATCPALGGLKELILGDNQISEAGALALAESPHLESLATLYLHHNPLRESPRAVAALRARFGDGVHF